MPDFAVCKIIKAKIIEGKVKIKIILILPDVEVMDAFLRTERLIGREAVEKLKRSKVAVFGLGGVGSYAAEALARSGLGRLVLVDGDNVCFSNLNRQIHATIKTLGRPKTDVMKERILDINPEAQVTVHKKFFSGDIAGDFITDDLDYIVDAIDAVQNKIDLIAAAKEKGIRIISSMGAGNKLDPTKFRVGDIYATSNCPLAKVMRRELKKRGIDALKVVYSIEIPKREVFFAEEDCGGGEDGNSPHRFWDMHEGAMAAGRTAAGKEILGSVSFVPPVAGFIIAGEVVKELAGLE